MYSFANSLSYISMFSVLIPIIFYLIAKEKKGVIKVLFILLLMSLASDLGNEIFVRTGRRGYQILNTFFIIQFFLLSNIYYRLLNNKLIVYYAIFLFSIFFIINTSFIQSIYEYQSWCRLVGGVFIIIYTANYHFQLFKTSDEQLHSSPLWLNGAVSFYFSVNLYLVTMANSFLRTCQQM